MGIIIKAEKIMTAEENLFEYCKKEKIETDNKQDKIFHYFNMIEFAEEYASQFRQEVSDEERLKILEDVKFHFDICSDSSTFCLGYRNLVKEIDRMKGGEK